MTYSDYIFEGLFLCGTGVGVVVMLMLGFGLTLVLFRIRGHARTDRINKLNPALEPLTVSYYLLPIRGRGTRVQYRGQVNARPVIFHLDNVSISISVAGQYAVPVSISRAAAEKTPANPGAERRAIQLSDLIITTPDRAWCDALVADPIGRAALLRLMADKHDLVSFIVIQPDKLVFYLQRPNDWKFHPPFLNELDYGLFRPWIDDTVGLAEAAATLPRPKSP